MNAALEQYLPLRARNVEDVRKDVISHHVLRLAFCGKTHHSWFMQSELQLLTHRLGTHGVDIAQFLRDNGLEYSPVSDEDFEANREALSVVYHDATTFTQQNFYAVPFLEALPLMR